MNLPELKEKENLIRKLMRDVNPAQVLQSGRFSLDSLNLLIVLQMLSKFMMTPGRLSPLTPDDVASTLYSTVVIAGSPTTMSASRFQSLKLVAILITQYIRPLSILNFLQQLEGRVSDSQKIYILTEIVLSLEAPSSSHASSESSKLLEAYGAEVFPILLNNQQFEVLEKWIDYIPGSLIMGSSLFPTPSFLPLSDYLILEDIMVKCCQKVDLRDYLSAVSVELLRSDQSEFQVTGLKFLAALLKRSRIPSIVVYRLTEILQVSSRMNNGDSSISTTSGSAMLVDMSLYEAIVSLLEESDVLDRETLSLLVQVSAFPSGIERAYPCRHRKDIIDRQQVNEEDSNDLLRKGAIIADGASDSDALKMFLSDALRLLGSIRSDHGSSYSQGYWQEVESVIHALSALAGRLPSSLAAESVCAALLGAVSVDSSSRPVVTTTVHAFMAFSPSLIGSGAGVKLFNNGIVPFVIRALSMLDTIDYDFGWFDFRSKQDNSAVGYLHFLASNSAFRAHRDVIDVEAFAQLVLSHVGGIKQTIFVRDPFRQTRDILVRSIASILIAFGSEDRLPILMTSMCVSLCEDAVDIANFLSTAVQHRMLLWEVIHPHLPTMLAMNAEGIETIVTIFADCFTTQDLLSIVVSPGELGIDSRWLKKIPDIFSVHRQGFLSGVSNSVSRVPLRNVPERWFTLCLIEGGDSAIQEAWLTRILGESGIPSSLLSAITKFCVHVLLRTTVQWNAQIRVDVVGFFCRQSLAYPSHDEPLHAICLVAEATDPIGVWEQLLTAVLSRGPAVIPPGEKDSFQGALRAKDYRTMRRFLKKFYKHR
eukprot:gene25610-34176_t